MNTSKLNTTKLTSSKSFIRKQSKKVAYSLDAEDDPNAFLKDSRYKLNQYYQKKFNNDRISGQLPINQPKELSNRFFAKDSLIYKKLTKEQNNNKILNKNIDEEDYEFERDLLDKKYNERLKAFKERRKNYTARIMKNPPSTLQIINNGVEKMKRLNQCCCNNENNIEMIVNRDKYECPGFNTNLTTYVPMRKLNYYNDDRVLSTRNDTFQIQTTSDFSQYKTSFY
jgi:hypothetical protein